MSTEVNYSIYSVDNNGETIEFSKEECIKSFSGFLGEAVNISRNHLKNYVRKNPLSIHMVHNIHRDSGLEEYYAELAQTLNIPIYVSDKDEKNLMKKKFPNNEIKSLKCSLERKEDRVPNRYFIVNVREDLLKEIVESEGFFSPTGGTSKAST